MIDSMLEDSINDFFFYHIAKDAESWTLPVQGVGISAWYYQDVVRQVCDAYELQLGSILKTPMDGLISFHRHSS